MPPIVTTLNAIQQYISEESWQTLLGSLGKACADDEPLLLTTVLDSSGLHECLRCCQAVPERGALWARYALWAARPVQHLTRGARDLAALDVAERYLVGKVSKDEISIARDAAACAAFAACAVAYATEAAVEAVEAVETAKAAVRYAVQAVYYTVQAVHYTTVEATGLSIESILVQKLRRILDAGEWI